MMLGLFRQRPDMTDKMRKDMDKKREQIIQRAAAMRKLVGDNTSGWGDYVSLLEDYVSACKRRKAVTALDTADDKTLAQLKLLDHEVWLIETFILKIPAQMIALEEKSKEQQEVSDD